MHSSIHTFTSPSEEHYFIMFHGSRHQVSTKSARSRHQVSTKSARSRHPTSKSRVFPLTHLHVNAFTHFLKHSHIQAYYSFGDLSAMLARCPFFVGYTILLYAFFTENNYSSTCLGISVMIVFGYSSPDDLLPLL